MELREKLNLPKDIDRDTYLNAVLDKLGLENLKPLLPADLDTIREKQKEDEHLNNIPLRKWDAACGYTETHTQPPQYLIDRNHPFQKLLYQNFKQTLCVGSSVCILKYAAKKLTEEEE